MDKFDFAILHTLVEQGCITKITGVTIKEMCLDMQPNTIYKRISKMKENGYILSGFKDSRANTYYISTAGLSFLKEEIK